MKIEEVVEEINNNDEYRSFLEFKEKMAKKGYNLDKKFSVFRDARGDLNIVEIYINIGQCFMLKSKSQQGEDTRIYEYIFSS